ncbi:MAG: hypothetical protein KJ050_16095 [Candidatus Omnitrophica bacterium]|nr:hypothetical protein [bacterium]MCC6733181.1 hypothetical protein [Candidatus Omnitrophota bacterium]MCL4736447.1 hypothetical protein [Candidatus Omnitrophota bacterium]
MPFEIKPTALYSKTELEAMLQPFEIDVDHFLGRIQCPKKFRSAWLGEDLIEAIKNTPPLADRKNKDLPEVIVNSRKGKKKAELIGGVFSCKDLGITKS